MSRHIGRTIFFVLTLGTTAALAAAAPDVQDHNNTPGVRDPNVTQGNIQTTICVAGYTETVRPHLPITNAIKKKQIAAFGYSDKKMADYEEDHLISLEIGGSPADESNLWPEHYSGKWGARTKDILETELRRRVCSDATDSDHISLAEAQSAMADNWVTAFDKYICHRRPKLTANMKAHC
jgi:hypothetical protein